MQSPDVAFIINTLVASREDPALHQLAELAPESEDALDACSSPFQFTQTREVLAELAGATVDTRS